MLHAGSISAALLDVRTPNATPLARPPSQELLERYGRMRLAVEMANDRQECTSYERLAKRLMQQERQSAAAKMLAGRVRQPVAAATHASAQPGTSAALLASGSAAADDDERPRGDAEVAFGCTYKQLILVTRKRDAARKASRAAAARQQQQRQPPQATEGGSAPAAAAQRPMPQAVAAMVGAAKDSLEGSSSDLLGELPLTQAQEPVWRMRCQCQQEQQQPNSQDECHATGACLRRLHQECTT